MRKLCATLLLKVSEGLENTVTPKLMADPDLLIRGVKLKFSWLKVSVHPQIDPFFPKKEFLAFSDRPY